jgi:hypothetical protein
MRRFDCLASSLSPCSADLKRHPGAKLPTRLSRDQRHMAEATAGVEPGQIVHVSAPSDFDVIIIHMGIHGRVVEQRIHISIHRISSDQLGRVKSRTRIYPLARRFSPCLQRFNSEPGDALKLSHPPVELMR